MSRRRNHLISVTWRSGWRPWVSIRIPGTRWRIGHRL